MIKTVQTFVAGGLLFKFSVLEALLSEAIPAASFTLGTNLPAQATPFLVEFSAPNGTGSPLTRVSLGTEDLPQAYFVSSTGDTFSVTVPIVPELPTPDVQTLKVFALGGSGLIGGPSVQFKVSLYFKEVLSVPS
ncbi:MAG: hypothetical protein HC840_04970 [Leptolyngbyaceae cyanobacterium RM2_2_4]|nr:hypothetical protein [Leptolyngbyaceae cyanobacterium RM2_2_4]